MRLVAHDYHTYMKWRDVWRDMWWVIIGLSFFRGTWCTPVAMRERYLTCGCRINSSFVLDCVWCPLFPVFLSLKVFQSWIVNSSPVVWVFYIYKKWHHQNILVPTMSRTMELVLSEWDARASILVFSRPQKGADILYTSEIARQLHKKIANQSADLRSLRPLLTGICFSL